MAISNIEHRGYYYDLYNEAGKKYKTISDNIGNVEGFGADFFVVSCGAWYHLYDETGKKYKTLSIVLEK